MKIVLFFNFITGVMLGFEFIDDGDINHFIIDLLIARIDIVWGDIEAFEFSEEE